MSDYVYSEPGEGFAVTPSGDVLRVGDRIWLADIEASGTVTTVVGEGDEAMLVVELDEPIAGNSFASGGVEMARRMEVA